MDDELYNKLNQHLKESGQEPLPPRLHGEDILQEWNEKLRPCPFCGGDAVMWINHDFINMCAHPYWIECRGDGCWVQTPTYPSALYLAEYWNGHHLHSAERPKHFYFWKFIHNFLVHPLMAGPWPEPEWLNQLHDFTAKRCPGNG